MLFQAKTTQICGPLLIHALFFRYISPAFSGFIQGIRWGDLSANGRLHGLVQGVEIFFPAGHIEAQPLLDYARFWTLIRHILRPPPV